jgi:peptidyl-prolyl cis-trans isomerase SurA
MKLRTAFACLALIGIVTPGRARADGAPVLVDRIVAVVDDEIVTLGDLKARAEPHVKRLARADKDYSQKHDEIFRGLLMRRIDELLVAKEADRLQLFVTPDEVDHALAAVAKDANLSVTALEAAVKEQGLTMPEYRAELRRQILEAKWLNTLIAKDVVAGRGPSADDRSGWIAGHRDLALKKLRDAALVEIRP